MGWLNNRKIVFKIALLVLVLGATSIGAIAFASYRMQTINEAYTDLVSRVDKSATMSARAGQRVEAYVGNAYQLAVETTQQGNKRLFAQIGADRDGYLGLMDQALKALPEKAGSIEPLIAQFKKVFAACDVTILFASEVTTEEEASTAIRRLKKECVPETVSALEKHQALVDDLVRYAASEANELRAEVDRTIWTVVAASATGLVLSLALAAWIGIAGLSRPIARLKVVMEAFAKERPCARRAGHRSRR